MEERKEGGDQALGVFGLAHRRVTVWRLIENIEPRRANSSSSRAAAIVQTIYYRRAGVGTSPQTLAERLRFTVRGFAA